MGVTRYSHYADDVTTAGTWSVQTGTAQTDYEAVNLGSDVIAHPAKIAEQTGAWLVDFGAAQRVDAVVIPMHNLDAGLNVRIQGNATDSWGTPTLDVAITIPAYRADGFPLGAWKSLVGETGYSASGFQFWRFVVVGTNTNPVAAKLKLLAQLRTLSPNISWGEVRTEDRPLIIHETDHGVESVYDLAVTRRMLSGDLDSPDAQVAAVLAWRQSVQGRVYPFVLIPDDAVNDAWFVRFDDPRTEWQLNLIDRNTIRISVKEVSRGMVL